MRDSYEDVVSPGASNSLQPILYKLMNGGVIKDRLKVPPNVSWERPSVRVYDSLVGDFMRPRINEVDELLLKGVDVTIYAGQVDLVAPTKGTEAWVHKLNDEDQPKPHRTQKSLSKRKRSIAALKRHVDPLPSSSSNTDPSWNFRKKYLGGSASLDKICDGYREPSQICDGNSNGPFHRRSATDIATALSVVGDLITDAAFSCF
ncbi:unnamed protein product [Cuscuta campestris]|uniref:Uncharacterized protein n=1 Tax=Cuscuta campestris TaxID=132261 RepID=A0A484N5E5_9ASTE|nr:unnamed protein product [Cuscuta campestris]